MSGENLDTLAEALSSAQLKAARRFGVQCLYGFDLNKESRFDVAAFRAFCEQMAVPDGLLDYLRVLVDRTITRLTEIDELISRHCHNWKLSRIGRVDLSVLRVCTAELMERGALPIEVSIADAAEIGKEFGSSSSSGFLNGVLDGIAKDLRSHKG